MRNHLAAIALVAAAAVFAPEPAWAQQGADVVTLRNGGMLRGTVVAIEPGKEVTILVLGTNVPRTLPWADVDHVERAPLQPAAPLPPAGQPPARLPAEPPPVEPGPGAPRLHVLTDAPSLTLFEHDGEVTRPLCAAPCDRVIDGRRGQTYHFGGPSVPDSPSFQLANHSGSIEARVAAGSGSARVAGGSLILFGGIGAVTGLPLLIFGGVLGHSQGMEIGGGITTGAGTALVGTGVALLLAAGRTKLTLVVSGQAKRRASEVALRPAPNGLALSF